MKKPDWRKAKDYAFGEKLSSSGWAWEFLRRGNGYRTAFTEYLDEAKDLENQYGADWHSNPSTYRHDLPLEEGENCVEWKMRCEEAGVRARRIPLDAFYGKPFHLDGLFDPMNTPGDHVLFISPHSFPRVLMFPEETDEFVEDYWTYDFAAPEGEEDIAEDGETSTPKKWMPDGGGVIAFDLRFLVTVFDLELSIDDQITELKKRQKSLRVQRGRKRARGTTIKTEAWTRYLRVLDADLDEATDDEIAEVLEAELGGTDDSVGQVQERRKEARRWTKPAKYVRLLYVK